MIIMDRERAMRGHKAVAVLGSTGSIGTQTLDVIRKNSDRYSVFALTAGNNADLLISQCLKFAPKYAVIADESKFEMVKEALRGKVETVVMAGNEAIAQVAAMKEADIVLVALVGYSGLAPTIAAIKAGHTIALANKETLVVAGDLVTDLCIKHDVRILPVDSEHSAIFQCLEGERHNEIEKIILTASGGPFRGWTKEKMKDVTPQMALRHPNWNMGAKITIDSATMMNKGFEVMEAKWLFGLETDKIDVVVHPQSIIHSMVQFKDGAIKAQLGTPDMRIPIALSLSYPDRLTLDDERVDFAKIANLTFEKPDLEVFQCLALAYEALRIGGNAACAVNAANEIVVRAFLDGRIGFLAMPEIIEKTMRKIDFIAHPTYEEYVNTDTEARRYASEFCN